MAAGVTDRLWEIEDMPSSSMHPRGGQKSAELTKKLSPDASDAAAKEDDLARKYGAALIEATNRAEATALLIRQGDRVYRPESDYDGEDLLVWRKKSARYIRVQLKSRLRVSKARYGGKQKSIWMLFPSGPTTLKKPREWYLIPHDRLYEEVFRLHGQAPGWRENWGDRFVSANMRTFLAKWSIGSADFSN